MDPPSMSAPPPRKRPSLRIRLTLWMVAIALAIQLTLGYFVFLYQTSALNSILDKRIRERSEPLASYLESADVRTVPPLLSQLAEQRLGFPPDEATFIALYDQHGAPIAATPRADVPSEILQTIISTATRSGVIARHPVQSHAEPSSWRIIGRRIADRQNATCFLIVGRPDSTFDTVLEHIRRVIFLSLPVGVLAAGVAGWLIAGIAVAPVRRIREMADTLAPETIEQPVQFEAGVAELQSVQTAFQEMRDRIRNAFVARDRFLASVSHELKTPIAVILTEAQILDTRGLTPEASAFVRSVIDETRRLSRTIESILTLTKVRAGKSLMEHSPCAVSDFVMDAVIGCSRMALQHRVTLNPLLAEADQPRNINGDCELLRVMVDNLLRNAIRFSPPDSQVLIHVTESPSEHIVAVRDFGPPVHPGPVSTILDPASADNAAEGRDLNLDLSIAQAIAELHAGQITAHNITSGGCEFVVQLPLDPLPAASAAAPTESPPPGARR